MKRWICIVLFSLTSGSALAVEREDSLSCSYYSAAYEKARSGDEEALAVVEGIYDGVIDYLAEHTFQIRLGLPDMYEDGDKIDLSQVSGRLFTLTRFTLKELGVHDMAEKCKEKPDAYLEQIARAMFAVLQRLSDEGKLSARLLSHPYDR
jgi:hypothetical protein